MAHIKQNIQWQWITNEIVILSSTWGSNKNEDATTNHSSYWMVCLLSRLTSRSRPSRCQGLPCEFSILNHGEVITPTLEEVHPCPLHQDPQCPRKIKGNRRFCSGKPSNKTQLRKNMEKQHLQKTIRNIWTGCCFFYFVCTSWSSIKVIWAVNVRDLNMKHFPICFMFSLWGWTATWTENKYCPVLNAMI